MMRSTGIRIDNDEVYKARKEGIQAGRADASAITIKICIWNAAAYLKSSGWGKNFKDNW